MRLSLLSVGNVVRAGTGHGLESGRGSRRSRSPAVNPPAHSRAAAPAHQIQAFDEAAGFEVGADSAAGLTPSPGAAPAESPLGPLEFEPWFVFVGPEEPSDELGAPDVTRASLIGPGWVTTLIVVFSVDGACGVVSFFATTPVSRSLDTAWAAPQSTVPPDTTLHRSPCTRIVVAGYTALYRP